MLKVIQQQLIVVKTVGRDLTRLVLVRTCACANHAFTGSLGCGLVLALTQALTFVAVRTGVRFACSQGVRGVRCLRGGLPPAGHGDDAAHEDQVQMAAQ